MRDGPLDMRMNPRYILIKRGRAKFGKLSSALLTELVTRHGSGALTAADIVNTWAEEDIARVLWEYGEERRSRSIARKVVAARETKQLETTAELCRFLQFSQST